MRFIQRFIQEEEGQGIAEYALILAFMSLAVIASLKLIGPSVAAKLTEVNSGF